MVFLLTAHLSHPLPFSPLTSPPTFSLYIKTISTHTALLHQPTLITPVLCRSSLVHTHYSAHTPHFHYIQSLIHYCCTPCCSPNNAVGSAILSYNLLFTFIPIAIQLNTFFIPSNTFLTSLILHFISVCISINK